MLGCYFRIQFAITWWCFTSHPIIYTHTRKTSYGDCRNRCDRCYSFKWNDWAKRADDQEVKIVKICLRFREQLRREVIWFYFSLYLFLHSERWESDDSKEFAPPKWLIHREEIRLLDVTNACTSSAVGNNWWFHSAFDVKCSLSSPTMHRADKDKQSAIKISAAWGKGLINHIPLPPEASDGCVYRKHFSRREELKALAQW